MSVAAREEALLLAILAGAWSRRALHARITRALDSPPETVASLVTALRDRFRAPPDERTLRDVLRHDVDLGAAVRAVVGHVASPSVRRFHLPPLAGASPVAFAPTLPRLDDVPTALARIGLHDGDLAFFAGDQLRGGRTPLAPSFAHYRYRWIPKANGGLRLLEVPKPRLRAMQRALLDEVLSHVPLHSAAHAFTRGRSARTFAAVHAGTRVVVRLDLEDFFAAVGIARVIGLFAALGYPDAVARVLARLACHRTPSAWLRQRPAPHANDPIAVARAWRATRRFARPHLPQGAPSSPRLASLVAFGLDVRLAALARRFDATYARYADDLAFSGDATLARGARRLVSLATSIANDEGFAVRFDKTRVMPSGGRQELAGLVVNAWPDLARERYDALRARLHRVATGRDVPASAEERERLRAELEGHVAWASSRPNRARKLARLLDAARARLAD